MVKLIALMIFLLNFEYTNPQSFKLGGSFDFMLGNEDLAYELGPALNIEYLIKDISISINGCVKLHLTDLNDEKYKFSSGYGYTIYSMGFSIKYYPIIWDIEPYIGYSQYYNFYKVKSSEMRHFVNGFLTSPLIDKNDFSSEITGGLILTAKTPVNLFVEVTQSFNKPEYDLILLDSDNNKTTRKETFNFNALFIKLGVRFGI